MERLTVVEQRIQAIISEFKSIATSRLQDKWPFLMLELINGTSVIGTYQCDPKKFIFSSEQMDKGRLCARPHHIVVKSANCLHPCRNCGCVAAIAEICGFVGTDVDWIPDGYRQTGDGQIEPVIDASFECNFYIHQAKIRRGNLMSGLVNGKLAVTLNDLQTETSALAPSLSPHWNETLRVNCVTLMRSPHSVKQFPPILVIDLYDMSGKKVSFRILVTFKKIFY